MDTITTSNTLKTVHAGLPSQNTAQKTQQVMLFGADGTPNGKIPLSTDAVIDLKTGQKLSDILEHRAPAETKLYIDMGLPSGVLWAKANIDITTESGFQEVNGEVSPFKYECSFVSWGNTDMYNPTSASAFAHNWGTANSTEPYVSSPGASLTGNIAPSQDTARANLGAPWRMPTMGEYAELIANIDYVQADGTTVINASQTNKLVSVNGIKGVYIRSKINGNLLFFPCSGRGVGQNWNLREGHGNFWSSSFGSAAYGKSFIFNSSGFNPQFNSDRYCGFAVRPVQ